MKTLTSRRRWSSSTPRRHTLLLVPCTLHDGLASNLLTSTIAFPRIAKRSFLRQTHYATPPEMSTTTRSARARSSASSRLAAPVQVARTTKREACPYSTVLSLRAVSRRTLSGWKTISIRLTWHKMYEGGEDECVGEESKNVLIILMYYDNKSMFCAKCIHHAITLITH